MTDKLWNDAEIIHSYAPEMVPNQRDPQPNPPADLKRQLRQFSGTDYYHVDSGLLLTDGTKWLLDYINGYHLLTIILENLPAIAKEEDAFSVIDINQDGTVTFHDGRSPRQHLALSKLDLALPCEVRLYTSLFNRFLVVMLASEY